MDVNDKDSSSVSGSCMQKPTHLLHGYLILSVMTRIRVEFLSKRGGIIRIREVGGVVALHVDTRRLPKHASIAERKAINPISPSKNCGLSDCVSIQGDCLAKAHDLIDCNRLSRANVSKQNALYIAFHFI